MGLLFKSHGQMRWLLPWPGECIWAGGTQGREAVGPSQEGLWPVWGQRLMAPEATGGPGSRASGGPAGPQGL